MLYLGILQLLSVGLAFHGLLSFYHGAEKEIAWCNPWPKFLCIKGVVFATFWQGTLLQGMAVVELIDAKSAAQVQNLLVCIEMLIAAVAHFYIFPHEEWHDGYRRNKQASNLLKDSLALKDFVSDMKLAVSHWDVGGEEGGGTGTSLGSLDTPVKGGTPLPLFSEGSPLLDSHDLSANFNSLDSDSCNVRHSRHSSPFHGQIRDAMLSVVDAFDDHGRADAPFEDLSKLSGYMSGSVSVVATPSLGAVIQSKESTPVNSSCGSETYGSMSGMVSPSAMGNAVNVGIDRTGAATAQVTQTLTYPNPNPNPNLP